MKLPPFVRLAAIGAAACCISLRPASAQQSVLVQQMFDGRTLNGWSGDMTLWRVEDGAITGETLPEAPIRSNSFLVWDGGDLTDFELRLKFRILGGNSGVQYRSHQLDGNRVGGYQADIDADGNWIGILYDEDGRGILCRRGERVTIDEQGQRQVEPIAEFSAEAFAEKVKPGEWNDYVIRAEGSRVTQSINGITTIELDDREDGKSHPQGIIALQLHTGPAMKVQFKDFQLRLPNAASAEPATALSFDSCGCANCAPTACCGRRLLGGFLRRGCRR